MNVVVARAHETPILGQFKAAAEKNIKSSNINDIIGSLKVLYFSMVKFKGKTDICVNVICCCCLDYV